MTADPPDRHRFLIGSANPGKLREYREILAGLDVELVSPSELDPVPAEPREDADTFAANATAKARAYSFASGLPTIADDSGLEVYALRGAPGIRSRRFFGEDATAHERNERLLAGDGRVYHIGFTAMDSEGTSCTGDVKVCVPAKEGEACGDQGALFDSTVCP